jgi:uncharacterized protein (TIGR03083 family)
MTQQPLKTTPPHRITAGVAADRLATDVYAALLADLATVDGDDWTRPTECDPWTVRDMVAHLVGAAQGHASTLTFLRQYAWAVRHRQRFDGSEMDALSQREIDLQQARPGPALVSELTALAPRAVAGRRRRARLLGWAPVTMAPTGSWYEGMPTKVSMAELCAVVLTRDVWMHRLDIARALGRTPALDLQVDGRVVADLVLDWGARHRQPLTLTLTGPAGGTFQLGRGGPTWQLDALDFARHLAGRRPDGAVPDSALWQTRTLF